MLYLRFGPIPVESLPGPIVQDMGAADGGRMTVGVCMHQLGEEALAT